MEHDTIGKSFQANMIAGEVTGNRLGSRIAGGNTAYQRSSSDFYPTPPEVTKALLDFLGVPPENTTIWEPACGEGHMVRQMEDMGYTVIGTDIQSGSDFLTVDEPCKYDWIITNPPFSLSEKFIERCIELQKPFALLLKSQYWHAKKRMTLYNRKPPTYVLPLTWRPDFCFGQRGGGSPLMDVQWSVWDYSPYRMPTMYIPLSKPKL